MFRKLAVVLIAIAALVAAAVHSTSASADDRGWCYWHPYHCSSD